jgi:hypothetical protein
MIASRLSLLLFRHALVVALSVAASGSASAQAPAVAPDDERARASAAFHAAERAFVSDDYPEALRLFRAAFEAAPDDAVRFNLAVCLERLGRYREASVEYDAAAASASLTPDVRERARAEAAQMRARLGWLEIDGRPAGAAVRIDGAALCALPCRLEVDPGRHEVIAETAEASDRQVVEVGRGATATVTLAAVAPLSRPRGPGVLTWTSGGAAVVATGAAVYFGLRARALHDDYLAMPTVATRDDGLRMRDLTNLSIGVAVIGAIGVAIDFFVLARRPEARPRRPTATLVKLAF